MCWVRAEHLAIGDRRRAGERIAQEQRPELLAAVGVEGEDGAGFGIEEDDAVFAGGGGRTIIVEVHGPDQLAVLCVEAVVFAAMEAAAYVELALVDAWCRDGRAAGKLDREAVLFFRDRFFVQLAR